MNEINEKISMSKRNKVIMILIIIFLSLTIIGFSYAWFQSNVIGNETAKTVTVVAGELKIQYVDGPELNVPNITPGWTQSKTFSVQNVGDETYTYKIAWATLANNFINRADLVYSITSANGGGTLNQTQLPDSGNHILIINNIPIEAGEIQTYTITIQYLLQDYNQNSDKEMTLSGKIEILDIEESTTGPQTTTGEVNEETTTDKLYGKTVTDVFNTIYPIGSIYTSVSSTNPGEIIGGQWTRLTDTFLLAAGDIYPADDGTHTTAISGSADAVVVSHAHTANTYHRHGMDDIWSDGSGSSSGYRFTNNRTRQQYYTDYQLSTAARTTTVGQSGIGKNMPPYLTVYVWKRCPDSGCPE